MTAWIPTSSYYQPYLIFFYHNGLYHLNPSFLKLRSITYVPCNLKSKTSSPLLMDLNQCEAKYFDSTSIWTNRVILQYHNFQSSLSCFLSILNTPLHLHIHLLLKDFHRASPTLVPFIHPLNCILSFPICLYLNWRLEL